MSQLYSVIEKNNLMTNRELDFHYGQIKKEKKQDRIMKVSLVIVALYFSSRILLGIIFGI